MSADSIPTWRERVCGTRASAMKAMMDEIANLRAERARRDALAAPEFDIDSASRRIALTIHKYGTLSEGDLYTTIKALLVGSPAVVSEGQVVAASDVAQGWLQFIDGVKTQNFARDEQELATTKSIFKVMGHTGKAEYVPVFYTCPAAPAPEAISDDQRFADFQKLLKVASITIEMQAEKIAELSKAAPEAPTAAQAPEVAKTDEQAYAASRFYHLMTFEWFKELLAECRANAAPDRFFMDHGLWHDRVTGQHMYTQDQYDEEGLAARADGKDDALIEMHAAYAKAAPVAEAPTEPMPPNWPAYGIIDPDYARYYSIIRATAWQYGYAIGMHGSFTRDLDLIAVPWGDNAREPDLLIKVIVSRTDLIEQHSNPGTKPHGRKVWTLLLPGFGDPRWIDLSIVPLIAAPATEQAKTEPAGG